MRSTLGVFIRVTSMDLLRLKNLFLATKTQFVVDPSEEKLKTEFEGVKRTHVPVHAVVRVDEVDKHGVAKITEAGAATVATLPLPGRRRALETVPAAHEKKPENRESRKFPFGLLVLDILGTIFAGGWGLYLGKQ